MLSAEADAEFQDSVEFQASVEFQDGLALTSSGKTIDLNGNNISEGGSITASTIIAQGMLSAEADAEFQDNAEFQASVEFQDGFEVSGGDIDCSNAGSFDVNEFVANGSAEFQDSVEFSDGDVEFTAGGGQTLIMGSGDITSANSIEAIILKATGVNPSSISASNGMIIYNSSTNKFQGRANGVWVDLH